MPPVAVIAGKLIVVLVVAVTAGVAVTLAAAFLGHEILVRIYGEDLAPIDDTPPMIIAVWSSYLAGIIAALVVLIAGWRRITRDGAV